MSGLRSAIKAALPKSWESVLRQNKMLTKYVEYVYLSLPSYLKGNKKAMDNKHKRWQKGLDQVRFMFKNRPIYSCIQGQYVSIKGIEYWQDIWYKIQNNENLYR